MDLTKLFKHELLIKCEELGIVKCKSKTKSDLIQLITSAQTISFKEPETIKINKHHSTALNVLDLFCGCGGMSKGLTDAGLNVIAGIDIWDKAIENYNKNFLHKAYCEDLTSLSPEKFNSLYNKGPGLDEICHKPIQIPKNPATM
jgi:predicted RNA methylase